MHVAPLSIYQSYLRQRIVNHIAEYEMYVQVKDKLQQQSLEKRYEGYRLEEDGLLTYKNRVYIPNVADLRRMVMDEIHFWSSRISKDDCYSQKAIFLARNEKGYG